MHMMSRRKKMAQDAMTSNEPIKHVTRLVHTTLMQCLCTAKSGSARSWARSVRGEKIHVGVNMERASYWMALVYACMTPVYSASDISRTAGPC